MKLIIDPSNYLCLKPVLAKEVVNSDCEVIIQERKGKGTYSVLNNPPLLELDDGTSLFSPNIISSYIFQRSENSEPETPEIWNWLDWESSLLQPVLHTVLVGAYGGAKPDTHSPGVFINCLKKLNESLRENKFLLKNELTLIDVIVWSDIYPLASDSKLSAEFLKDCGNLIQWFVILAKEQPFQRALETLGFTGKVSDKLKKCISSIPVILFNNLNINDSTLEDNARHNLSRTTSTTETEEEQHLHFSPEELNSAVNSFLNGRQTAPPRREIIPPLLPQEGVKNILITSALPYVNNIPHLGNIIGCVLSADAFARYCRLRNYNTLYVCGTDEYGTATETKALEEKLTPQQICDKYFKSHSEIYEWFNISFDHFGRTTTEKQTEIAQDIFWRLYHRGYLLEDSMNQQLCEKCDRFLADRFIEGICPFCGYEDARGDQCDSCGKLINAIELKSPRCKLCKATPVVKSSKHLFLDLPKLEPLLKEWFQKSSTEGLWSSNAKIITNSWFKDGLKPRCITRDLKWGTPVPLEGYTDKVFYVWFDAPIGYLSITANYTDEWERWWKNPSQVQLYQFMAKDNVPFHAVIFPCSELGADDKYTIVNHLNATEYLNYEDGKFSKSRGMGVFGNDAQNTGIPSDIWRFYLLYTRPETQDSAFSWSDLMLKNNSELLNNLGNFINRALSFLSNNFGGVIPEINLNDDDKIYLAYITRHLNDYLEMLEKVRIRDAIRHILKISRRGNQHIQNNQPWVLIKGNADDKNRAGSVIGLCTNVACLLSVMIQPYMPNISRIVQEQLNAPAECNVLMPTFICYLPPGHMIDKPFPLFQKLENKQIEELKKRFSGRGASRETTPLPAERKIGENTLMEKTILLNDGLLNITNEELQSAITVQGDKVRQLKLNKAEKSLIQVEVEKLLKLKEKLLIATGQSLDSLNAKSKKKKK